ncbi:protein phosphatase 1H isoform X1 [Drosophila guanche]|uniref:Blast:Protein phosphatase 1H n=1 Tax=Drosophila guanche TaxID=7266 RepID=A0A3B0JQU2_DROGU|nr:protein phosphatase 1H isoform X1 [Drosophila guanche]XP_034123108.1 protein phosphatase 1H isoform X1 [Drosophila guanche]SPP77850.1 blast:Protein phosphatase 1H [Drosophila guanche]
MFSNFKERFMTALAPDLPPLPSSERSDHHHRRFGNQQMPDKFPYARPPFLQLLTVDELRASADHNVRPIIVPRDINLLPWGTGYAECVNSGKSEWNEDQGAFCRRVLSDPEHKHPDLPYTYFGIFDGHAGYGAALAASHQFHHILHETLVDCIELLLPRDTEGGENGRLNPTFPHPIYFQRRVSKDELIIGALESAFFSMDSLIAQDSNRYRDAGGCTACVSLFIDGKMYVANAGDSRAVLCQRRANAPAEPKNDSVIEPDPLEATCYPVPFSADHTPETERERLLNVARLKPHLMANQYVAMEYAKRPHIKDMGQRILCRQGTMKGWTYKTLTRDDLRMPVVNGEGKRSRLLGTLGVSRGFGDHELLAINTGIQIKPFLTPHPDVRQRDLTQVVSIPDEHNQDGDYGVLVMATDGLWDVSENEAVSRTVFQTLSKYPTEKHRYTMVAQELVARARGKINDSGHWRLADSKAAATVDDISVIVIPVYQYYQEHIEWTQNYTRDLEKRRRQAQANMAQEAQEVSVLNGGVMAEEAHVEEEEEEDGEVVVLEAKAQIQTEPQAQPHAEAEEALVVEISAPVEQAPQQQATSTAADVAAAESQKDSAAVTQQQPQSQPQPQSSQQRSRGKGNKGKHYSNVN